MFVHDYLIEVLWIQTYVYHVAFYQGEHAWEPFFWLNNWLYYL